MSFSKEDYQKAADDIGCEVAAVQAVADVESGSVTMWNVDGKSRPPVRLEAHWFGKLTGYKYNNDDPDISSIEWNPSLAAGTPKGAWDQVLKASNLDKIAAIRSTSWGAFQIMGDHWHTLGYTIPEDFVDAAFTEAGQMDMFVRFVKADARLVRAMTNKDWRTFASIYNGPGQVDVYAARIDDRYNAHLGGSATRVLHKGMKGDDVAELQTLLNTTADGDFGPGTEKLVIVFQLAHNLMADGVVGSKTMAALRG